MYGERDTGKALHVLNLSDLVYLQRISTQIYTRQFCTFAGHSGRKGDQERFRVSPFIYMHPSRFMERNLLKYINVSGD